MKVLHLIKTSIGASWAVRQTRELVRLGIEVHVLMPQGPMTENYRTDGVIAHIWDLKNKFSSIKQLRTLVIELRPDIIHSHFVATTLLMRIALRDIKVPRIFQIPGPLHLEHVLWSYLEISLATQQDYWLASCQWVHNKYISHGIEKSRLGLAYYGVDEDSFVKPTHSYHSVPQLRQQLNLKPTDPIIGMVAYFYPPKFYLGHTKGIKGHEDLVAAMAQVRLRFPKAHCVMVGGPWGNSEWYFEKVQRYARQAAPGAITFLGTQNHDYIVNLYQQFDLAVHPSHSENLGGAVESMYAKILTLTTNIGGFVDLIQDGETGYLTEAKKPALLAEKIIYALEHHEEKDLIIANAFNKVTHILNVKDTARSVMQFYTHVLNSCN